MEDADKRAISNLVHVSGFSRRNAEIALDMFRRGELTKQEEEVINRARLDLVPDDSVLYYNGTEPRVYVADHLNFRITQAGGAAATAMRKKWR